MKSNKIRPMSEADRDCVFEMMREFYTSPAVFTNGSTEIYHNNISNCVGDSPYLEGYIFENNNKIQGYAMVAKSFSTEFGKPCIWIEDLYMKPECRGLGLGTDFFEFIEQKFPDAIFRLEVEEENENAVRLYRKCGYEVMPYMEMKK